MEDNVNTMPEVLVHEAAVRGMIEIMISPEVGSEWLRELMVHMTQGNITVTEEMSEKAYAIMTERFFSIAKELAIELPADQQDALGF